MKDNRRRRARGRLWQVLGEVLLPKENLTRVLNTKVQHEVPELCSLIVTSGWSFLHFPSVYCKHKALQRTDGGDFKEMSELLPGNGRGSIPQAEIQGSSVTHPPPSTHIAHQSSRLVAITQTCLLPIHSPSYPKQTLQPGVSSLWNQSNSLQSHIFLPVMLPSYTISPG